MGHMNSDILRITTKTSKKELVSSLLSLLRL